ncbi:hypothetical protein AVEN_207999-1 [Araneus ventricosus]|uniref:Uncharacterized protein n=1 Tax=Araneus ventricosus TaxID=182803 RepID=A0A4Y2RCU7_ARAVE|nr:hypothetical protein AVEN_207999-1 [Araneus ventricosus]
MNSNDLQTVLTANVRTGREKSRFVVKFAQAHPRKVKKAIHRSSKMEFLEHGKEIAIVKMKKLCNLEQIIKSRRIQNPKLHPRIPIGDLYARSAANQKICLHWDLASRLQIKLELI